MFSYTEDWSNGCGKFSFDITGINYILKYIKIENGYILNSDISQYFLMFLLFLIK